MRIYGDIDMEILENLEVILAIIASIAVAISAPLTAFIAWKGLNSWKEQHKARAEFEKERQKAKIDYDLANKTLLAVYEFRNGIDIVRDPLISIQVPTALEAPHLSDEQRLFEGEKNRYEGRLSQLLKPRNKLVENLLEIEVLWGNKPRDEIIKMIKLSDELINAVYHALRERCPDNSEVDKLYGSENLKIIKKISGHPRC